MKLEEDSRSDWQCLVEWLDAVRSIWRLLAVHLGIETITVSLQYCTLSENEKEITFETIGHLNFENVRELLTHLVFAYQLKTQLVFRMREHDAKTK